MVHSDYSERDPFDAARGLRAKVVVIIVCTAMALWGIVGFVAYNL